MSYTLDLSLSNKITNFDVSSKENNLIFQETDIKDNVSVITLESFDFKKNEIECLFEEIVAKKINEEPVQITIPLVEDKSKINNRVKKVFDVKNFKADLSPEQKKAQREKASAEKKMMKQNAGQKTKVTINVVQPKYVILKGNDILALRFSQHSIDSKTGDGIILADLITNMKEKGWKKGSQICVVRMPDGLVSSDNRRLYAAKKVAKFNPNFAIEANIYNHTDVVPKKLFGVISVIFAAQYKKLNNLDEKEKVDISAIPIHESIQPNTYGHAMLLRINTKTGDLVNSHFGYDKKPIVRVENM